MTLVPIEEIRPDLIDQIKDLYVDAGLSLMQTASVLNLPAPTLRNVMERHGIPRRGQGGAGGGGRALDHREMEIMIFLYERVQLSQREVARKMGISLTTVKDRLAKAGVPGRSKSEAALVRYGR